MLVGVVVVAVMGVLTSLFVSLDSSCMPLMLRSIVVMNDASPGGTDSGMS